MKKELCLALAFAGLTLTVAPSTTVAEVRRIEIDVAGYLCGL